eukprot:SAG31_NODE_3397_length_4316_cov_48.192317_2_plen_189_part_00
MIFTKSSSPSCLRRKRVVAGRSSMLPTRARQPTGWQPRQTMVSSRQLECTPLIGSSRSRRRKSERELAEVKKTFRRTTTTSRQGRSQRQRQVRRERESVQLHGMQQKPMVQAERRLRRRKQSGRGCRSEGIMTRTKDTTERRSEERTMTRTLAREIAVPAPMRRTRHHAYRRATRRNQERSEGAGGEQ